MNVTVKKSKRIFYLDALRALAIIAVILIHIFDGCTFQYVSNDYGSFNWFFAVFINNGFRIGVDLFLMLSGALSLGRNWDIKEFLSRRIPRIVKPFVFWGLILSVLLIVVSFVFHLQYLPDYSLISIIEFIGNAYLSKSIGFIPYWFFWMILGTYLIMPIFDKWVSFSNLKDIEYFLVLWLITCIFSFTLNQDFVIKLTYFTSPIGLVVLGYYLRNTERKLLNNPYVNILMIIMPLICLMILTYLLSDNTGFYMFNRYNIFLAIEVSGIFLLFKNAGKLKIDFSFLSRGILYKIIMAFATYSYGLYLVHRPLTVLIMEVLPFEILHYKLYVLLLLIIDVVFSFAILYVLNKIPIVKDWIGVK